MADPAADGVAASGVAVRAVVAPSPSLFTM
jgi:hypothetical protein